MGKNKYEDSVYREALRVQEAMRITKQKTILHKLRKKAHERASCGGWLSDHIVELLMEEGHMESLKELMPEGGDEDGRKRCNKGRGRM